MTYSPTLPEDRWSVTDHPGDEQDRSAAPPGRLHRFVRGRRDDPVWVRPALLALLGATAAMYMWGLGGSGWANSFYSAAVQAGTKSWKAFFFGSFDSSNFITVDKSPGALWVMELSARIFGLNPWSILGPEALEGVGTVGFLYLAVRRWFTPAAGLVAGAVAAVTPVAALMFRYNNPDALMVLLVTMAAYATIRAVDDGRDRWAVVAGTAVGFAFLAKMLEAFLVVPALALVILVSGNAPLRARIRQLLFGAIALTVASGWWVMAVQLTPSSDRPFIGGSQDNSLWNLMFGYNGFGRLSGNESGSVGGGAAGTSGRWGATGLTRLFGSEMGTQISWLLPAALMLLAAGLVVTRRAHRTNRTRTGLILWGGWLVVAGLAFSLGQGIIHPYYTVALAPPIGGLIGAGGSLMWANRDKWVARAVLAATLAATGVWAAVLLDRTPSWLPGLKPVVVVAVLLAAGGVLLWPYVGRSTPRFHAFTAATAILAVIGGLAAPVAYTLDTVRTPQGGAIPSAGPTGASTGSGPGGFPGMAAGRFPGRAPGGFTGGAPGRFPGGAPGGFPGRGPGGFPGRGPAPGSFPARFGGGSRPGFNGNPGAGGLLGASRPSAAMVALLRKDASHYKWVAATVGANEAAGYQLATGDAVMAMGGFNGTDPYPTLIQFEKLVREGKVHYFIAGGGFGGRGFGGGPGGGGDSSTSSAITSWVESHYPATTVGGVNVYDLTAAQGS